VVRFFPTSAMAAMVWAPLPLDLEASPVPPPTTPFSPDHSGALLLFFFASLRTEFELFGYLELFVFLFTTLFFPFPRNVVCVASPNIPGFFHNRDQFFRPLSIFVCSLLSSFPFLSRVFRESRTIEVEWTTFLVLRGIISCGLSPDWRTL